jgi:benzoyl-CoA reductase/2-hydroxyglutaryl-CoA dehydratase subunit BcrC/BadD/HgdB
MVWPRREEARQVSAGIMRYMREKLEAQLKPALEMLWSDQLPNGRLRAPGMEILIGHYEETFRAMEEQHKKLCWYEFCITPELFFAMDIHPFNGELHTAVMNLGTPDTCWRFIDAAEADGAPPELCALDKIIHGALLENEMPRVDFVVAASAPCDSSRIGYQMFEQLTDCPFYRLDAPVEDSPEAYLYYAGELRRLIGFLEQQTGSRLDVDRLREVCEESNRASEALLELFELKRARPCPLSAVVTGGMYMAMLTGLGLPQLSRYTGLLRDAAAEAVRQGRGALTDERHRVLWYYVPVMFDIGLHEWLQERFGAVVIMDFLNSFFRQDPIDTTSVDTMLLGLARRGLETSMSRLRVDGHKLTERFLCDYEHFGADCVVFPSAAGCKHVWGWLNLLRETCRERGIPICVFDIDLMDSRIHSADSVRMAIEEFFETMME